MSELDPNRPPCPRCGAYTWKAGKHKNRQGEVLHFQCSACGHTFNVGSVINKSSLLTDRALWRTGKLPELLQQLTKRRESLDRQIASVKAEIEKNKS